MKAIYFLYGSSQKNGDILIAPPRPDGLALFMLAIRFPFHMHVRTIGNNGSGLPKCKNGKPARSLADYSATKKKGRKCTLALFRM